MKSFVYFVLVTLVATSCMAKNESTSSEIGFLTHITQKEEIEFFNEVTNWYGFSSKFYGVDHLTKRKEYFAELATKGFMPAKAFLMLFDIEGLKKTPNYEAFEILEKSSQSGDISSGCAIYAFIRQGIDMRFARINKYDDLNEKIERGIKNGHAVCEQARAYIDLKAINFDRKHMDHEMLRDVERFEISAASKGYYLGQLSRQLAATNSDTLTPNVINRSLCWVAAMRKTSPRFYSVKSESERLEFMYKEKNKYDAEIEMTLNKWNSLEPGNDLLDRCATYENERGAK